MERRFYIYQGNGSSSIIWTCFAKTDTEALDLFAGYISGYDTFSEMMRSAYFSHKLQGVFAA